MYPGKFDYVAAASLDEALSLLSDTEDAKVLAGGQSLIPLLRLRFAAPAVLVDVNRVPGLDGIEEGEAHLRVGAMTRHNALAAAQLATPFSILGSAAPQVADPLIRNLGTVGGSLAHADPAGDWGAVMLALGAELVARSRDGERVIAIDDFFHGVWQTALEPNELLTEIRIPRPQGPAAGTYLKLERKVGDFATVGVAVQLELQDGHVARAGIGLTAVGPQNLRAAAAEEALQGAEATPAVFAQAARLAAQAAEPTSDIRGSEPYKRHIVEVFVNRGLAEAAQRAQAG